MLTVEPVFYIDDSHSCHVVLGLSSLAVFALTKAQDDLAVDVVLRAGKDKAGKEKKDTSVWKDNLRRASVRVNRNSGRRSR